MLLNDGILRTSRVNAINVGGRCNSPIKMWSVNLFNIHNYVKSIIAIIRAEFIDIYIVKMNVPLKNYFWIVMPNPASEANVLRHN